MTEPAPPSTLELSLVLIPLMKGVVAREEDLTRWQSLLALQPHVQAHVAVLGLQLILDEAEGHAFLRALPEESEESGLPRLPRLVARRQLSYPVSLLLALLRKKLMEFDAGGAGDTRLVLSKSEVVDQVRIFLPAGSNEARITDQIESHLNKICELGFLQRLKSTGEPAYELRRILKAFVDAQWLADFDARLETYRHEATGNSPEKADEP